MTCQWFVLLENYVKHKAGMQARIVMQGRKKEREEGKINYGKKDRRKQIRMNSSILVSKSTIQKFIFSFAKKEITRGASC